MGTIQAYIDQALTAENGLQLRQPISDALRILSEYYDYDTDPKAYSNAKLKSGDLASAFADSLDYFLNLISQLRQEIDVTEIEQLRQTIGEYLTFTSHVLFDCNFTRSLLETINGQSLSISGDYYRDGIGLHFNRYNVSLDFGDYFQYNSTVILNIAYMASPNLRLSTDNATDAYVLFQIDQDLCFGYTKEFGWIFYSKSVFSGIKDLNKVPSYSDYYLNSSDVYDGVFHIDSSVPGYDSIQFWNGKELGIYVTLGNFYMYADGKYIGKYAVDFTYMVELNFMLGQSETVDSSTNESGFDTAVARVRIYSGNYFVERERLNPMVFDDEPTGGSANPIKSEAVFKVSPKKCSIVLGTGWEGNGPYHQLVNIPAASEKSKISIQLTDEQLDLLEADNVWSLRIDNDNGVLTAFARGGVPSSAMTLQCSIQDVLG